MTQSATATDKDLCKLCFARIDITTHNKKYCSKIHGEQHRRLLDPTIKTRDKVKNEDWRGRKSHLHILKKYGLDPDSYNTLLIIQNECCAICDKKPSDRKLSVDHDHSTRKVRGLLCRKCNTGIGMLGDNKYGIERALSYFLNLEDK